MNEAQTLVPNDFVALVGGLHDVRINGISFDLSKEELTFDFDDLNANYEGLPEYTGADPGALVFGGVTRFAIDIDSKEGIRISDARVFAEDSVFRVEMDLSCGAAEFGGSSIVVHFRSLTKRSSK